MNDEEWNHWAWTYAQEQRPMPAILVRARTDRGRAILALAIGYAIVAVMALAGARELSHADSWAAIAGALFPIAGGLAIMIGVQVTMRATFASAARAPLELLADLERRHAGRRRLIRIMPWMAGLVVAGTVAIAAAQLLAAGRFDPASAAATLAICAATAGFVRFVVRRVSRLIDRELRAAAEARRLLGDDDDGERTG
jgi:hypothetical protein